LQVFQEIYGCRSSLNVVLFGITKVGRMVVV
jgi:hypothetical protein